MRLVVWLRDGNEGGGREAEWVMLFIKCTKNECVQDFRLRKKMITHHVLENTCQF